MGVLERTRFGDWTDYGYSSFYKRYLKSLQTLAASRFGCAADDAVALAHGFIAEQASSPSGGMLATFDKTRRFRPYLVTAFYNHCRRQLKKDEHNGLDFDPSAPESWNPEWNTLAEEAEALLSRVGDQLHREVLEALREEFGTGAPSAAMARFQREREALQRKIDQALENMGVVNAQVAARVGAKVEEWSARQREVDAEIAGIQARQAREIDLDRAADEVLGVFRDLAETGEDAPREVRHRLFSRTVARIELEFEVDPARAHRRAGRNRCVGGPITVTPLVEEGASLLPCGSNLVMEAG